MYFLPISEMMPDNFFWPGSFMGQHFLLSAAARRAACAAETVSNLGGHAARRKGRRARLSATA
jgi:hypothetical protein